MTAAPASREVTLVPRAVVSSPFVGLATRVISFVIDAAIINLVAIIVALGVSLILSVVHLPHHLDPLFETIAGVVYVVGTVAYFVVFWSANGQTPGARVMRIRVVTYGWGRITPRRAIVRCIGAVLGALPLFLGYFLVLFDNERRAFPDRLARTLVVEASSISVVGKLRPGQPIA